jgi:beta-barrel assembly-enhancing protease
MTGRSKLVRALRWGGGLALGFLIAFQPIAASAKSDDNRTKLKPGVDRYGPDDDVKIGHQIALELEHRLPMLNDDRVNLYLSNLGNQLAVYAPGPKFAYEFHCINSRDINAFALPGGFVFINRGTIEASRNEAQLAAIIAHEIAHIALRHGTNQATKREIWSAVGVAGDVAGGVTGGALGGVASQVGGVFAIDSVLLKYSRAAETQADVLGTQILHDAGYDPRALGQFFEVLDQENAKKPVEFFADHPNNEHRVERVNEEVDRMGGVPAHYVSDSKEFREIRRYLLNLDPPPHSGALFPSDIAGRSTMSSSEPPLPSVQVRDYDSEDFRLQYPDNWVATGSGNSVRFAPPHAKVRDAGGHETAAYGVLVNLFQPAPKMASAEGSGSSPTLDDATNELIASFQQTNPHMQQAGQAEKVHVDGEAALSVRLTNDSPRGGHENDWLVTVMRPQGLLYFVCTAPAVEYDDYDSAFQQLIASIRFAR